MKTYKIPRHKVFISYNHEHDQKYKDFLIALKEYNPEKKAKQFIFDNRSVDQDSIDDSGMTNDQVRKIIRDKYIGDATVLILLCGLHTRERKFIDWEIQAAMFDSPKNPKLGILVINLPTLNNQNGIRLGQDDEKNILDNGNSGEWHKIQSRDGLQKAFPALPSRIIDNFEAAINHDDIVPITVVEWNTIKNNIKALKTLIHNAFKRGRNKSLHYNYSAKLKGRNR